MKLRDVNSPYEVWESFDGSWVWRVIKKYQSPAKEKLNSYAIWRCAVKSPFTRGGYDVGDVYRNEIMRQGCKVLHPVLDRW